LMQVKLKTKLALTFLLVTFLIVALISILSNIFLTSQFKAYTADKLHDKISSIVDLLATRYGEWGNHWNESGIESIGTSALSDGFLIRLSDKDGTSLWDARVHHGGVCDAMLSNIAARMQSQDTHFRGGYVEESFAVSQNDVKIGQVAIGYYGPYFFTDADVSFLHTLNRLLLLTAFAGLAGSLILAMIMARQLSRPIMRVIETTEKIASGNYRDRIDDRSSTKEVADLTTSINSLAETLGRQEDMRKQLTKDVAHELRTPLSVVQSHLEAMIDGVWPAEESKLKSCHDEILRMSRLVGDLEKLTALEQDYHDLHFEPVDLEDLLRRIASHFQNDFARKKVSLILDLAPGCLDADQDKLSQVVINLLSNALKYTDEGGTVRIGTTFSDKSAEISVSDTGVGIAPADLPLIFDRFYRADKSRSRETGGSGIGLAIVKKIVEAHSGKVAAFSEPGQGSRFVVSLPRTQH
jgi:two-component system, OmpR family, sensor histidine kinase BaeS